MKLSLTIWLFLVLLTTNSHIYAAEHHFNAKIAIVDTQLVFDNAISISNIKQTLDNINESLQLDVSSKELELKTLEATLVKKKDSLGAEEFNQETDKFNKEVSKFQQVIQTKKVRLEQAHNEAFAKVYEAMKEVINQLAAKYGFNLVISNSLILMGDAALNITDEVISLLNQKLTKVDIKF